MQNDKWIILGQFHWTDVSKLFKNSCNHTNWLAVSHLGHLLDVVISYGELVQYETDNLVEYRSAMINHYWVACKEEEKESTLKFLNDEH